MKDLTTLVLYIVVVFFDKIIKHKMSIYSKNVNKDRKFGNFLE